MHYLLLIITLTILFAISAYLYVVTFFILSIRLFPLCYFIGVSSLCIYVSINPFIHTNTWLCAFWRET